MRAKVEVERRGYSAYRHHGAQDPKRVFLRDGKPKLAPPLQKPFQRASSSIFFSSEIMSRRFLLAALAVALLATEAASAQTVAPAPAATKKEVRQAARAARRTGRTLTAREKRAAAAAAKAAAATPAAAAPALAWSGWSNDPLPGATRTAAPNRAEMNVSVAPGMPLNQVGHGVTTDYDGHPVRRPEVASTTLPTVR